MKIVETKDLVKVYNNGMFKNKKKVALNKVDLEIEQGAIFGLIGPNGSGKTTFINLITGFIRPTSGSIKVFNNEPGDIKCKKDIGYLPEKFEFQNMTGRQILDFYGCFYNISAAELKSRIEYLIDITGLTGFADMETKAYSKGTLQKLGVAQALINEPKLLILDEPYNGLDPETNQNFRKLFRKLSEQGTTIIISSHLLSNIESVCSHIGIIANGSIIYSGTPDDLTEDTHKTLFSFENLAEDDREHLISICDKEFPESSLTVSSSKKSLEAKFLELIGVN
ncbi:MAG: ABC transporter ATP-binding protein [Kiritimatiellae bacterium]|jgi:ABC-2 type transport system ATP-binding protein|nr:ABC transporter ATP-binding protein [Kiritimatiellia bacterium]